MDELARLSVAVLFNSLWEGAIFAFAVWLVLRVLPNASATTRYAAWCIALCASMLLPLATALGQVHVRQTQTVPAVSSKSPIAYSAQPLPRGAAVKVAAAVQAPVPSPAFRMPARPQFTLPNSYALAIFGLWALAALLLLVRLTVNLWRLERLKRDSLPLPVDYREGLSQWMQAEKGGREVRLCVSHAIEVPVAVGLFDSMILLPAHLLETLTPAEIDQIMLHELGHLRRADDWTNGLQRVVQALFFFNPAVLFIAQQLDLEREVACDDWVLRETKSVRPYAHCLTKMAEVTAWPHRALAAPGVFVTRRGLSLRVERLLRAGRNVRTSVSFGAAGAVTAALIMIFFVLQTIAPSYAFTQTALTVLPGKPPAAAREKIIYIERNPDPRETTLIIPGQHVHVPERTIHIPAINIDVNEQRIKIPAPPHGARSHTFISPHPPFARGFIPPMPVMPPDLRASGLGGDFSRQNLNGHDFRGKRLTGADFAHANLQNADFSNSTLTGTDFSHSSLRGANFSNARMTGCDLSNADVSGANFSGVSLTGCDLAGLSLTPEQGGALVRGCRNGCDLRGVNAQHADLHNLRVNGLDLSGADLRGANLSGSTFSGVEFTNAKFDGANLTGTTFINCSFEGVDRSRADFGAAREIIERGSKSP